MRLSKIIRRGSTRLCAAFLLLVTAPCLSGQSGENADVMEFYTLRAGDSIQVTVFNEPDLTVSQKLDKDGVIIIPLLGRTDLSGKTLREAESYLESLYISEDFLLHPQVTVSIAQYAEQVFYIFGEVNAPGAKTFPEGRQWLDILEAISMAGDLSQYAKRSDIILRRPIKGTSREEKIAVDLEDIIRGRNRQKAERVRVYPGDIIFVPERLF